MSPCFASNTHRPRRGSPIRRRPFWGLVLGSTNWKRAAVILAPALLLFGAEVRAQSPAEITVHVSVLGEDGKPLAGAAVDGSRSGSKRPLATECKPATDGQGHAVLHCRPAEKLHLSVSLKGYLTV